MTRTPVSLLVRLRDRSDRAAWARFVDLYGPLLYEWLHHRFLLQHHDAAEVSQEVLLAVVQEMPSFRYDQDKGSFRRWLYNVMRHRLLAFWRQRDCGPLAISEEELQRRVEQLQDAAGTEPTVWADEYDSHVVRRVLGLLKADFEPTTWRAFWAVVVEERKPADVAGALGITANAVRLAKFHVLKRLRQEFEGLLD